MTSRDINGFEEHNAHSRRKVSIKELKRWIGGVSSGPQEETLAHMALDEMEQGKSVLILLMLSAQLISMFQSTDISW